MEGRAGDFSKVGGADRDRTDDLVIANDALYQLSYSPEEARLEKKIGGGVKR
ncbi:MAG: hypothetical protein RL648_890 [Verrucomicrobiota bacterium]|jgi:hypothetical protein